MNAQVEQSIEAARALNDDIVAYIERADELLKRSEVMSLSGLDSSVEKLCKRIIALDPETAKQFAPQLEALLTRLSGLQDHMKSSLAHYKATMDEVTKRQRANKAYKPPSNKG